MPPHDEAAGADVADLAALALVARGFAAALGLAAFFAVAGFLAAFGLVALAALGLAADVLVAVVFFAAVAFLAAGFLAVEGFFAEAGLAAGDFFVAACARDGAGQRWAGQADAVWGERWGWAAVRASACAWAHTQLPRSAMHESGRSPAGRTRAPHAPHWARGRAPAGADRGGPVLWSLRARCRGPCPIAAVMHRLHGHALASFRSITKELARPILVMSSSVPTVVSALRPGAAGPGAPTPWVSLALPGPKTADCGDSGVGGASTGRAGGGHTFLGLATAVPSALGLVALALVAFGFAAAPSAAGFLGARLRAGFFTPSLRLPSL